MREIEGCMDTFFIFIFVIRDVKFVVTHYHFFLRKSQCQYCDFLDKKYAMETFMLNH